ncbi:DUF2147 domain-containing protein [Flavobacterium tegetincola]|uniref:DUF2147 domain-containing protein n=1 Tax=Flavobacterium tegetincola TaxID=150172 RepID=UPI000411D3BC|nr:DUF2147 domain-containing protein [Flavobacterium tegetincola]
MKIFFLTVLTVIFAAVHAQSPSVLGKWKSIDDQTGKPLGIVQIYEQDGKIHGKVIEIVNPKDRDKLCNNCSGEDKNQPILGLLLIRGLTKDGNEYNGGKILDPKHGKYYKCYINLENENKLKVRGYYGISLFGRTQYWHRVE